MRNSRLLAPLFNPSVQGILAATTLNPDREWYLSDLAAHLRVGPSTLQRALTNLTQAGILLRRKNGNRVYYRADPQCPILPELSGMLVKTAAIAEPLRKALAPFASRIQLAFIHGSIAQGKERSESDVDLIVVGNASNADLALALRTPRQRLGREINLTRYTAEEFAAKITAGHHFLSSVLRKARIFVIGNEHDMENLVGRKARSARAYQQAGA